jgi:hypothetical protein
VTSIFSNFHIAVAGMSQQGSYSQRAPEKPSVDVRNEIAFPAASDVIIAEECKFNRHNEYPARGLAPVYHLLPLSNSMKGISLCRV